MLRSFSWYFHAIVFIEFWCFVFPTWRLAWVNPLNILPSVFLCCVILQGNHFNTPATFHELSVSGFIHAWVARYVRNNEQETESNWTIRVSEQGLKLLCRPFSLALSQQTNTANWCHLPVLQYVSVEKRALRGHQREALGFTVMPYAHPTHGVHVWSCLCPYSHSHEIDLHSPLP